MYDILKRNIISLPIEKELLTFVESQEVLPYDEIIIEPNIDRHQLPNPELIPDPKPIPEPIPKPIPEPIPEPEILTPEPIAPELIGVEPYFPIEISEIEEPNENKPVLKSVNTDKVKKYLPFVLIIVAIIIYKKFAK